MAKVGRFIIQTSDGQILTSFTHCQAWEQTLELWKPGLTVTCTDTQPHLATEERLAAAEQVREKGPASEGA